MATAYLVQFAGATGPQASEEIRYNGGPLGGPPTAPWAAYFTGAAFDSIDVTLTATTTSGTALLVPGATAFELGGFRVGKQCTPVSGAVGVAGVLLFVQLEDC